jgi:hypothetical protein
MQLRSLPPYLCLSLQRFVFDMQVGVVVCDSWSGIESCAPVTLPWRF